MKILKYTKLKNNTYKVDFEQGSILLYDDIIIRHELLLKKRITEKEFEEIKKENEAYSSYYMALQYLNKKMRTRREVEEYLKKENVSPLQLKEVIQRLEKEGYLNDLKYTTFFVNDQLKFSLDGPDKIKRKLEVLGIASELIDTAFSNIDSSVWEERIEKMIQKRAQSNHKDSEKSFKNKMMHYLISNGYPLFLIEDKVEAFKLDFDSSIILKEKEKLERKLSKKYDRSALKFQVKNKLYQKGFSKDEIDSIM